MKDGVETLLGFVFAGVAIAGLWLFVAVMAGLFFGVAVKAARWVM